jgi:hypothetical protein
LRGLGAGVVVLAIQQYLSTRWSNFMVPLMVAVAGSLTIPSVAQSARFWKYDPWTYGVVASVGNDSTAQLWALTLSLALAAVVVALALWDSARREQPST